VKSVAVENTALRSDMMLLVVDKKQLSARLETWPADPAQAKVLRDFKIAIGKGEGDKEHEGDNRTPEGVYFAQSHRTSGLPQKYGPLAIPIDFPNPMDQILGKTGHGIWLHGVAYDARIEEAKVTEGCVAFYNADIEKLSSWMRSHQGVVVIASDVGQVNQASDVDRVKQRTVDWMNAWADRKIDDYMAHYAPDFRFGGMNKQAYGEYKGRVFDSYKVMSVTYDNLRVVTHPKYAVSFFNQDFQGDKRFSSIGRKVLYWEKAADGEWYVKREIFENRRFESVTFSEAELALLSQPGSGNPSEKDAKSPNL
jgi:murein L,D-transpeptidase YafK